ncbi:hypothetical protein F5X96DRAFT_174681 [Biscogniauxia mediterranea]|nr:hypothetical protein F5X96DRAFT_174681 [Biscogniauxia mediterranea]
MDPVSAVGLVAATAQFMGIAVKTLRLCRQIRDNAESATDHNELLETFVREVKASRQNLTTSPPNTSSPAGRVPRRIVGLATECGKLAEELLKLLQEVRGAGKHISTMRKVIRAIKEQRKIEKLENSLKNKERALESALTQDIWHKIDLISIEQSDRFTSLDVNIQTIITSLAHSGLNSRDNFSQLIRQIDSLQTGIDKVERNAVVRSAEAETKAYERDRESQQRRTHEMFLESLFFREIRERQSYIKDPAPGTLDWVFGSNRKTSSKGKWDDFVIWLRQETSVYWICGKLGSGKSTLMAHIVEDSRTKEGLEAWSRGHQLQILTYFFWRPGTALQKNIIGLLRSLLYQICQANPSITERLMASLSITDHRVPLWTEKSLRNAISLSINLASDVRFAIFLDGLDEFLGDYDELVNLIFDFQTLDNVKVCVSSRPEVQLASRLSECKKLRLESLNWSSIHGFVEQKLGGANVGMKYLEDGQTHDTITDQAEGVFLWAVLVTQDMIRGAKSGDDEEILKQRVATTPSAIEEVFAMMLARIDRLHRESLAFYLGIMSLSDNIRSPGGMASVPVIAAAKMEGDIGSWESFLTLCKKIKVQVVAQSAGLLEVEQDSDLHDEIKWRSGRDWFSAVIDEHPDSLSHQDFLHTRRIKLEDPGPYPTVLSYECKFISWVHRSAYDFIHSPEVVAKFHLLPVPSCASIILQLVEGALKYFVAAPSYRKRRYMHWTVTVHRLRCILEALNVLSEICPAAALVATDRVHALVLRMDSHEFSHDYLGYVGLAISNEQFWFECAMISNWHYMFNRIHIIPPEMYAAIVNLCVKRRQYELGIKLLQRLRTSMWLANCALNNTKFQTRFIQYRSSWYKPKVFEESMSYRVSHEEGIDASWHEMVTARHIALSIIELWRKGDKGGFKVYYPLIEADRTSLRNRGRPEPFEDIFDHLHEIASTTNLYTSLYTRMEGHDHLSLQLSLLCLLNRGYSGEIPAFRIVCIPWKDSWELSHDQDGQVQHTYIQEKRFIIIEPRAETVHNLLPYIWLKLKGDISRFDSLANIYVLEPQLRVTREQLEKCFQTIVQDVETNEQGLDATEQQFALACIREHLFGLLESIWKSPDHLNITDYFDSDSDSDK